MKYCYMTDTGKVRDHNEDSVVITENQNQEILPTVSFEELPHPAALSAAAAASAIIIFLYFIIITSRITVYIFTQVMFFR